MDTPGRKPKTGRHKHNPNEHSPPAPDHAKRNTKEHYAQHEDEPAKKENTFKDKFFERAPSWIMAFFTAGIFGVTLAYTIYARQQVFEMQKANQVTARQFIRSERPWIYAIVDPMTQFGNTIRAGIELVNYGKSPAVNVTTFARSWISIKARRAPGGGITVTRADAEADADQAFKTMFTILQKREPRPGPIPPGSARVMYQTVVFGPFPKPLITWALRKDNVLMVVGHIKYFDISGNGYSTDYCAVRLAAGGNEACARHNQMR